MEDVSTAPLNDGSMAVENSPDQGQGNPYGEKNEQLPEVLKNALQSIVAKFGKEQGQYQRRREVIRTRKLLFYERGHQHVYADPRSGFFAVGTGGSVVTVNGQDVQLQQYLDDWNLFTPTMDTIVAVMTQNPPGVDFLPNNPDAIDNIEAATNAEGYRHIFDRMNDVRDIQKKVVRMFGCSGRTIAWTRTIADEQKFGKNDNDGTPRRMQTTDIFGTLESKIELMANDLSETPYCFLFKDLDIKLAKQEFPSIAKKIKQGSPSVAESTYERTARLGVLDSSRSQIQAGDVLTHLSTKAYCFLRPAAFVECEDEIRQQFQELFPQGCLVTYIGDVYAEAIKCSMDDQLTMGFPYNGEGTDRRGFMDNAVTLQDAFNDAMNGMRELWDHCYPTLWIDAEEQEIAAILSQKSEPGAIRGLKVKIPSKAMADLFFREPDPTVSEPFQQYVENIQGPLLEFILGTPPSIWGGESPDNKTASGRADAKATAMGRLGLIWSSIQAFFASIYYQAALAASQDPYTNKPIMVAGANGMQSVSLQSLQKGKFGAYPDQDSSFPESTGAKRTTLSSLFTMAAQTSLGQQIFESPKNWELIRDTMGTPDLHIQQSASREKQLWEIELLLHQNPLQPDPQMLQQARQKHAEDTLVAKAQGLPMPPPLDPMSLWQSSIPIDPQCDYNQFEWETVQEWLSSPARREAELQGKQKGILNVRLHGLAHQAAMPPPMPMPMPAPHGGGHGPKPPIPGHKLPMPAPPGAPGSVTM